MRNFNKNNFQLLLWQYGKSYANWPFTNDIKEINNKQTEHIGCPLEGMVKIRNKRIAETKLSTCTAP